MGDIRKIVHDIADQLPEEATFDDAIHAIYVRQKLERAIKTASEGNVTSQDAMEERYIKHAR